MEDAARQFARKILIVHLALLVGVIGIVFFASNEVYKQTKNEATAQAKARQSLLAGQTARGIEAFYQSILNDLDLARQAGQDDGDEADAAATTQPAAPGPKIDWRRMLMLDDRPNPINAPIQNLLAEILWKQVGGRVSNLFVINRDRVGPRGANRPVERMQVLQPIGINDRNLTHEMIVQKSIDWLRGVDRVQISRFQQYEVDGKNIGLNLICVPVTQRNPRLLVAAVRIDKAKSRFTSQLNSDNDSTNAVLSDDAGTIMIASRESLVGRDINSLKDERLRQLAGEYLGTGKRGVEGIDTDYSLAGQTFPPALVAIEPVSIAGKKWTFIVTTPLSDIDNVVNRVFKRAIFWAIFVVGSVMAILVSTSVQLIRGRIRMERVRNDLLTRELSRAREIQLAWLPRQGVAIPCLDVAAVNQPASHISGDFYNWFELPDGRTVVTIGDVTGHGLSAAFLMATTQLLVHTTMLRLEDPGKTLYEVNKQLCVQVFNGQFVTMLICVIDMEAGLLEVATAGHYPPILGKDGEFHSLPVEPQLVLGVEKDVRYQTERFDLPASASLILYTDGVIDAQSPQGKRFDIEQIIESIKGRTDSAQVLLDAIVGRVNHFRQQRKLPDDLTLVCIQTQVETSYNATEAVSV